MATYIEQYDIWMSTNLKKQLVMACLKAANDIVNESAGTTSHTERLAWARLVFKDPFVKASEISAGVIQNATVQSGVYTDNDIQYVVNSLIDVML